MAIDFAGLQKQRRSDMRPFLFFLIHLFLISVFSLGLFGQKNEKPRIAFSFDDGSVRDYPGYRHQDWNRRLLANLATYKIRTVLFVKGAALENEQGKRIIRSWDQSGHLIGNHSYQHLYFHNRKVSLKQFESDMLKNEHFIRGYKHFVKLFRFPYLKEGNSIQKRDGFRGFLKQQGYRNAHVTVDASDWYIDQRLCKRLRRDPKADLSAYREYYVSHIIDRARFYDRLAFKLTKRRITHVLLLHHNLSAALFLKDLIQHFRAIDWETVDIDIAYGDQIYKREPRILPAGESLVWALAKESGAYDSILRYPAEGSRYEKKKMDRLGL